MCGGKIGVFESIKYIKLIACFGGSLVIISEWSIHIGIDLIEFYCYYWLHVVNLTMEI